MIMDQGNVVMPGDLIDVASLVPSVSAADCILVGPGLETVADGELRVTQPGLIRWKTEAPTFWLDVISKRYVPVKGDRVLGLVTQRLSEGWKVDIGAVEAATVSYLAFEGATKRNRPDVNVGDLLYCQIVLALPDMEPEVVCMDSLGKARGMGVLPPDGLVVDAGCHACRRLLSPNFPFLSALGKRIPFEATVGLNGRVYVKTHGVKETIAIANALPLANNMEDSNINRFITKLADGLAGF